MERTLSKLLIIAIVVCVAFAVAVVQAAPQESAGLNGEPSETAEQQPIASTEKTYPLGLSKNNYILFVVGMSIGSSLLASIALCCCFRRCRRRRNRRRYIQPEYSAMKPGEKKFESRQSVLMVPARDVLFPTQLSAVHEKSRLSAKDGDMLKWPEKSSIERHPSIRVPRNSARKNWTPGADREPSGELKAKSWLAEQEQQRETRKNWLQGVEAQREDKTSWVAGLAQRSTSPEPSSDPTKAHLRAEGRSSESRRSWISGLAQREGIDTVASLPSQTQREVARESRRSSFIASLKQRETNPDADSGNTREQSRDGGRRSWNPEVARRESLKRGSHGSRRSTTYRPNEASNNGNAAATKAASAGEADDTGRSQSGRRQSLYGESGTMWETVLERV